ncbi:right-handed parallel beta-helix repeat-containing protein [Haloferula rosea]|uniref:right-handed parallel beta-helix repeat-containing protein n=1 Tax=Haloferula rosea TaxID=490093 RepID=UPI0019053B36|nr:right-handed parallel beta-helix repeat-containing protein [Haloferula rosea]
MTEQSADLRTLISDELAAGNKRIVIPPGRYRVQAEKGEHLVFKDLKNVEIIAYDVELVCTSTVRALLFDQCSDVTIRGLKIDYDPLPFTQGTIVSMAEDKSSMVFKVAAGYPEHELIERIQIYDPGTAELRRDDASWDQQIEPLGESRYRVRKKGNYRFNPERDTEQIGDILVTNNAKGTPGPPHAVDLRDCKNMRLEDITLHASPCFGFLEKGCDGSIYRGCRVVRRDPRHDPVQRALPRMRSLNADAFHSKDAGKGPAIVACTAHHQGDDAVNINGEYHYVASSQGRDLRIVVISKLRFRPGDPVEFLPHSGPRPPDAVVTGIRPASTPLTDGERALLNEQRMDNDTKTRMLSSKARILTLTLDREVNLPPASAVCCPLRVGNGFSVTDCDFGHNRSRGILIKASKGEVVRNRIIGSRMAAVLIRPEFWWLEGGLPCDIEVSDNTIKGSLQTPIQILAIGGNNRPLPAGALRNISIVNNRIEDCAWPLIRVTSAKNLTIEGNTLPDRPKGQSTGPDGKAIEPIVLEYCEP